MKKNLKKVISAVLALTLAMSSFVALATTSSAATFADVADTASYAEAVNALAALGAISGYEDGTFLPDNNITRAEVTTMVVAALNMTADAQNSGSTTKFADVNANAAWAAGYVNVGVAQGFISGMSATEFAPADNVTYAQILTMLTRILGYGDFAVARGGYPDGYLAAASTAGILSGVTASANDAVTRAQVAQLIWNAVQAPMLDITTFSGNLTDSEMQKMDGKDDRDFRTVLSDKFDAYVLNVEVDNTSKMDPDNLEIGDITMTLTGTNDWDPENEAIVKNLASSKLTKSPVAAGKTAAENYVFSSAKVVAEYNDDDEWTLLYFAPTSKVSTKAVDGELTASVTASELAIKKSKTSSSTTKYNLTDDAVLYVNGVKYDAVKNIVNDDDSKNVALKLLKDSVGDVVLYQDSEATGTKYNRIMMDVYALASVNQVSVSGDDVIVRLASLIYPDAAPGNTIEVLADDVADGEKVVTVTKAGAAIDVSALAKGDVIAVKYDITKTFDACRTLEILATNETITGQYTSYDDDEEVYIIGGAEYEAARTLSIERGNTYTFRLDPAGRLFAADEEATTKNYAIVERFVNVKSSSSKNYLDSSSEYSFVDVVTLDGQSKRLYIESSYLDSAEAVLGVSGTMKIEKYADATATNVTMDQRVIAYTVKTSTGRINKVEKADTVLVDTPTEYNESSNRFSKTLASAAVVLDATDYDVTDPSSSDYKASSLSALVGSVKYEGFLVHKNSSNEYGYVVITSAGSVYGPTTDFAVAAANASTDSATMVDDEEVYTLKVMENGGSKASTLNISTDAKITYWDATLDTPAYVTVSYSDKAPVIKKGAAFLYTVDSYGLVDQIDVIFNGGYTYADLLNGKYTVKTPDNTAGDVIIDEDWLINVDEKKADAAAEEVIQIFVAPVILSTDSSVTFGVVGKDYVDTTADYGFTVTEDSKLYSYDLSDRADAGVTAFNAGAFSGLTLADTEDDGKAWFSTLGADVDKYETDFNGMIQMAFVMAVDGVVTNAIICNN
ncbi:MAG: S-layer homology domain-containing protein [Clostridia bacterium]|nr:S-layer homology domain-containing protein [Clostridia bacterium]